MKISHINIRDVRGVKSMDFKPATINYITGPSGSGKSSVMDAIRYGITGRSRFFLTASALLLAVFLMLGKPKSP